MIRVSNLDVDTSVFYISRLGLRPETEEVLRKRRFNTVEQLLWVLADNPNRGFCSIKGLTSEMVRELEDALKMAGAKIRLSPPEQLIAEIVEEDTRAAARFYFLHNDLSDFERHVLNDFMSTEITDATICSAVRLHYGVSKGMDPVDYAELGAVLNLKHSVGIVYIGIEEMRKKSYAAEYTRYIRQCMA